MDYYNSVISIELDLSGIITEIKSSKLESLEIKLKTSAVHLFKGSAYQLFYDHLSKIINNELTLGFTGKLTNDEFAFVYMLKHPESISLFAILVDEDMSSLFDEMTNMNTEQVKTIRTLYQKLSRFKEPEDLLEEMMNINNELINAKKELDYKNKELFKLNNELQHLNYIDFLTKLPNRRKFFKDIYNKVEDSGYHLTMTDFNNFKLINDTFGHQKGDELLIYFAKHMNKLIEPYKGKLYRLGGDEFAILIKDDIEVDVQELFRQIDIKLLFFHDDISMSYGVVTVNNLNVNKAHRAEIKMHEADQLLFTMKQNYYDSHIKR